MLAKYKIPASPSAGKTLIETLERRKNELQTKADYTSKELNDTIAVWQEINPGKQAKDVLQKASERPALEDIYKQNKAYYQQGLTEYQTAKEQLASDSTNKGIQRFLKENKPTDTKKQLDKEHIEAYSKQMDREIASTLDAKQKQAQVKKIDSEIATFERSIVNNNIRIQQLERENRQLRGFKNILNRQANRTQIKDIEAEISQSNFSLTQLRNRRQELISRAEQATQQIQNVSRTPTPTVQPAATTQQPIIEQQEF